MASTVGKRKNRWASKTFSGRALCSLQVQSAISFALIQRQRTSFFSRKRYWCGHLHGKRDAQRHEHVSARDESKKIRISFLFFSQWKFRRRLVCSTWRSIDWRKFSSWRPWFSLSFSFLFAWATTTTTTSRFFSFMSFLGIWRRLVSVLYSLYSLVFLHNSAQVR